VSSPLLLALDTSTTTASTALFDGERVLSETTWLAGREHTTRLLLETERLLERIARTIEDVTGLVVARGPGSFTGVRVALSLAKGMSAARGIPAWGVSSLSALALACPALLPVRPVVEAGRGRYATALYVGGLAVGPSRLMTIEDLIQAASEPTVVIGELAPEHRARLEAKEHVVLAPKASAARRAGFVAELGWRLAQSGDPGDPRLLDALYVS
jgi:tRNA threonylcarbamoyladenosine biosynthesis protein TsaB